VSQTTIHEVVTEKLRYRILCLLHDNARTHSAHVTIALPEKFDWDILVHPPHSPDLAPGYFHLFLHLNKHLNGEKFDDDDEVQEEVLSWLKVQAAVF